MTEDWAQNMQVVQQLTVEENDETTGEASKLGRTGILHETLESGSNTNETARSFQQTNHS